MATFLNQKQQQHQPQAVSAEQEAHRRREAQDLFKKLQSLLLEGDTPAMDLINEALKKFEELSLQTSRQSHLDPEIQKILEDMSALVLSARQMAKNKGIAERLQRIADETQKVTRTMKPGTQKPEEMNQDFFNFMNNWRPVFYLLINSREFRFLLLDSIRLAKRVAFNYSDTLSDEPAQKFLAGDSPKQVAQSLKTELKEKGKPEISDDESERIQDDIQRVLAMLTKDPNYRQGLERLYVLLDLFQKNLLTTQPTSVGLPPVTQNVHAQRAMGETEELISIFSGRETLEHFKFHLRNLIQKIQEDDRIHNYLLELKQFTLKARSEAEVRSDDFKRQSQDLSRRGQELFREWKSDDLRPFLDSANLMIENIKNDEFLQLLRHHAGVLKADLSYVDMEGKLQLDVDVLSRLQRVLLPVLADALKYLPLPRVSSSDAYREFWLDNIVLCSYDIVPENIKFHLESDSEFSFKDIEVKDTHTFLVIQLNHFRTELKDIDFYYKKKTFPELEDKGRVTFRIKGHTGANLTLSFKVEQKPEDKLPRILEGTANFEISDLDIEFDTSTIHHTVLVPMLTKMFKLQIKLQLEKEVEKNLKGWMDKLGNLIMNTIVQTNRPFLSGLEATRKAMKATEFGQIYQKRVEKLE